jgi:hypothetical protein
VHAIEEKEICERRLALTKLKIYFGFKMLKPTPWEWLFFVCGSGVVSGDRAIALCARLYVLTAPLLFALGFGCF